ncbi:hypothetical protein KM043_008061 [Ampulex compressa]|nr:hypothetical protein KM043_008061 [Ampulex compressa]
MEDDPWGRPYKVITTCLKRQSLLSPTDAALLEKVVTLLSEQFEDYYQLEEDVDEDIPPITEEGLLIATAKIAEHALFRCPRFKASRAIVEEQLKTCITPDNLVELMLKSADTWAAISAYGAAVMRELQRAERARKNTTLKDHATIEEASVTNP